MKNLDLKSWLIIVFAVVGIIFFSLWYFKGSPVVKDNIKDLKNQIAADQKERNILTEQRDSLILAEKNLQFKKNQQDSVVKKLQVEIQQSISQINDSKNKLYSYEQQLQQTQNQLSNLQAHPKNRTGKSLITSLQIKSKK